MQQRLQYEGSNELESRTWLKKENVPKYKKVGHLVRNSKNIMPPSFNTSPDNKTYKHIVNIFTKD